MALDPMVTAALVQGGANVLGGLMGGESRSSRLKYAKKQLGWQRENMDIAARIAKDQMSYADDLSRQQTEWFNRQKTQWQVEDAKRAGLHPLFALGGGSALASSPAVSVMGADAPGIPRGSSYGAGEALKDMGQSLARGIAAQQTAQERALADANLRVLESQANRNDAEAAFYSSRAATTRQNGLTTKPLPLQPGLHVSELQDFHDRVTPVAPDLISSQHDAPHLAAGKHTMWKEHVWMKTKGGEQFRVLLPYSDEGPSEGLESISLANPAALALFITANAQRYGKSAAVWIARQIAKHRGYLD